MTLRITHDNDYLGTGERFYAKFNDEEIETTKPLGFGIYVDLTKDNQVVGIEMIGK